MEPKLILKPGREKSLLLRHPWVFSGAILKNEGQPGLGETVQVCDSDGGFLAWAGYSPQSSIRARVWSFDKAEEVREDFFERRIERAIWLREKLGLAGETNAFRLIHGESDGLPGVTADRYGDVVVVQLLAAGAERWRDEIIRLLAEKTGCKRVVERSDADVRSLEGLESRTGLVWGSEPPAVVEIVENGLKFQVDVLHGQKTGFYLDQRFNRQRVGRLCEGRDVLNCFCYTGGFSVYALAAKARSVLSIDSSADALRIARENLTLNGYIPEESEWIEGDVFRELRTLRDRSRQFDLIVLDPPKFAPTAAQAERAARGYKDINLLAFKLLRPGGILATFSCSGGVTADLFQKIVAGAAADAGVNARILETLTQGIDHPVGLNFPEGAYLKGLICAVDQV